VPIFVLNQVNDERCEWLVPGMLKDKIQALLKTLHQRPRSRLVPLAESARKMAEQLNEPALFGHGSLIEAVLRLVRLATTVDVVRADIKLDMLQPHFFMNFRVVDEHGRQLGAGRNLGALKAELGSRARGAFQALANLKLATRAPAADPAVVEMENGAPAQAVKALAARLKIADHGMGQARSSEIPATRAPTANPSGQDLRRHGNDSGERLTPSQAVAHKGQALPVVKNSASKSATDSPFLPSQKNTLNQTLAQAGLALPATKQGANNAAASSQLPARQKNIQNQPADLMEQALPAIKNSKSIPATDITGQRYTRWTFGELPELLEIRKSGQTLIGYPALLDSGDAVSIEVFDEPEVAAAKHRAGLRRLFALQIRDALKYLEKNIPDLQKMAVTYMQVGKGADGSGTGGTLEELREQIISVALERAFLLEPLPTDEFAFKRRTDEGRARLTLIATEVARLCAAILAEYALAARKIKDSKAAGDAALDAAQQLARLMPRRFLTQTAWPALQHFARYQRAITARLEKYRTDPARDSARLAELRPLEQRYWRLVADRRGVMDERLNEFRWLLEELRVSFFAQELRTPQPVSIKRLEKAWAQLA